MHGSEKPRQAVLLHCLVSGICASYNGKQGTGRCLKLSALFYAVGKTATQRTYTSYNKQERVVTLGELTLEWWMK